MAATHADNPLLTAALLYPTCGWHVLPCKPRAKQPLTQHGLKDASTDAATINRWWVAAPLANVAIRCGLVSAGLVVIDVDGEEGKESLKGKHLPPTIMAKTGGGGAHYFYYCKERLRPKVGLLPKVDLRAEDSYVVAPPSVHPSGTSYEWIISPQDASPAPLPQWVIDIARMPEAAPDAAPISPGVVDKSRIGRAAIQFIAMGAPKGQQRLTAVAAARNLLSAGYSSEAVGHKLWAGFQQCEQDAEEPWTQAEAQKIASNMASSPAPPMKIIDHPNRHNSRKPIINVESCADLLRRDFPPVRFLIPGLWPEGMSLLAAKPKIGKTWCALGIGLAIAYGGVALGRERVDQGGVLYLALEDGERRIQSRLKALLLDQSPPAALHLAYGWPRVNEGGMEALAEWMQAHPETRLIVVDTLRKIRPMERIGASAYNQDYDAIAPLTDLAHEYNVSIWGISHLRKMASDDPMEMVSGTMGLTGAADHVLVLKRERGQPQGILHLMSRDVADQELALEWQPPHWILVGTAREAKQSQERSEICDLIRRAGRPLSPKEITDMTGKPGGTIRRLVSYMNMDGVLVSDGHGKYDTFPRSIREQGERGEHSEQGEQGEQGEQETLGAATCWCGKEVYLYRQDGMAVCKGHATARME